MSAAVKVASVLLGAGFGFLLSWGRMTDPDAIQAMLLLEDFYLYLMMASTIAVAMPGLLLLKRLQKTAALTGETIDLTRQKPTRNHVVGAAIFGLGWAVAATCPGPISAQLGQGYAWALVTLPGMLLGVYAALRLAGRPQPAAKVPVETETVG